MRLASDDGAGRRLMWSRGLLPRYLSANLSEDIKRARNKIGIS